MKNKLYKIIYLSSLLIDSQANVDSEMNNTIIPEGNTIIPKEENIIPETVINQKINIDMDLFINSKTKFIDYYCSLNLGVFFFYIIMLIMGLNIEGFLKAYFGINEKTLKSISRFLPLMTPIIIPILSYIIIVIINTNKYTGKYMKQYAFFKSWCLYMGIMLIYLMVTKDAGKDPKKIKEHVIFILIINNFTLITTYYMLKGYYYFTPRKYKKKRDYINSLNNNITPINVLDTPANNLDII